VLAIVKPHPLYGRALYVFRSFHPDCDDHPWRAVRLNRSISSNFFDLDSPLLVAEFDRARAADSTLTHWNITSSLMDFHLAGSDIEAMGGELAYLYGKEGNFSSIAVPQMQ